MHGPDIKQSSPEILPAPDANKASEQLGMENLTASAADGQPEQVAPAEESKGEPEKSDGKIIDITGKMAWGHDTPDKADKADVTGNTDLSEYNFDDEDGLEEEQEYEEIE